MQGITVREIVTKDFKAAAVFEKYAIDYCCHGNIGLDEACRERGVSAEQVRTELEELSTGDGNAAESFERWELDRLADYVVGTHHAFVREASPVLLAHTQKIAIVHGGRHAELLEIRDTFGRVSEELIRHMQKEELMLFPYIRTLARSARTGEAVQRPRFQSIQNPIQMMEAEHVSAGDSMERIRNRSLGYLVPADGCTTYRVTFQELEAFEQDLHTHVHLENNILFPKALELERKLFNISQ